MSDAARSQPFVLPALPWSEGALAPVISKQTIELHYGKHHAGYVGKLNELVAGSDMAEMPLEALVRAVKDSPDKRPVFNNAGQTWNHTFFWSSLTPERTQPSRALREKLDESFGGLEQFGARLVEAGVAQFGSGWAWLVVDGGRLSIETTSNADTPMARGKHCLLTIDVWEHAYYLDYQNRRADFLKAVVDRLLDWRFASERLEAAA